jgi:hypothetical protein
VDPATAHGPMPWRLYTAHMHYPSHPVGHIKLPLEPARSPLDPILRTLTEIKTIFKLHLRFLFLSNGVCAIHPDPYPVVTEQARPTKCVVLDRGWVPEFSIMKNRYIQKFACAIFSE